MLHLACTSILHLSSRWNWKKRLGNRWTCFGVRIHRTSDYPTVNKSALKCTIWSQSTPFPDRRTDR